MNKLLKYFLVLSLLIPLIFVSGNAQEPILKKQVVGSGSMIEANNGTTVVSSGTYNQLAVGKMQLANPSNTGDLFIGFWEQVAIVGVDDEPTFGDEVGLKNYPNPASSRTTISYNLPEAANVSLKIFDISGKLLDVIYSGFQSAGQITMEYDLTNSFGVKLTSGSYFYELSATPNNVAGGGFAPIHLRNVMIISK